jgi:hypothetical protein
MHNPLQTKEKSVISDSLSILIEEAFEEVFLKTLKDFIPDSLRSSGRFVFRGFRRYSVIPFVVFGRCVLSVPSLSFTPVHHL